MSTYKEIRGLKVRDYTTNPDNPIEGQLWYNTTDNVAKYQIPNVTSAWRTENSLNTARSEGGSAGLTSSAALLFGGYDGSPKNHCESFNGTAWTEVANLNTSRFALGGLGTYTAALGMGGTPPLMTNNESWNGSAWTESNGDLNTARQYISCAGDNTAGLAFGGGTPPATAVTELWNGSSWSERNDLNTARGNYAGGTGTSTSALMAGGTSHSTKTELWNGTCWSETTDINTGRFFMGSSKRDASNATAIIFGGEIPPSSTDTGKTELWNGSTWSEQNDLSVSRNYLMGAGVSTGALAFGGVEPPHSSATEEWVENASVGAWATGGTMNTARGSVGGTPAGTQSAAMATSGQTPSVVANVEQYNGTSWTEITDVNTARANASAAGTSTANLFFGGSPNRNNTELWNGSAWTEQSGDLNTGRPQFGGAGATNTAAIAAGGYAGGFKNETETWNGTSWTEVSNLNTARSACGLAGTSTASVLAGGESPAGNDAKTEIWNGTAWTESANLNLAKREFATIGSTYTSALVAGGVSPISGNIDTKVEDWNGASWQETSDISTGRYQLNAGQSGTTTSGVIFGGKPTYGSPPATTGATEEWSGSSTTIKVLSD